MQAPAFWHHGGAAAWLLAPLSWLYDAGGRARRALARPQQAGVPVICIGNLTAGGSGKTPTALAIAARLQARGARPHFLSRGYGGRLRGPLRVDPERHTAADVGDEPLLLARQAPTWIARDRVAGAAAAVAAGADAIVMDDGFQNPHLAKDLSLLVIDQGYGLGNGRVHPAGPLREAAGRGFARADGAVLLLAEDRPPAPLALPPALPVLPARLLPAPEAQRLAGQRVLAFAGIGRPARFFATLLGLGVELVAARAFPDHYPFAPDEIMALVEEAHAAGAVPVTTAKDHVRLPPDARAMVQWIEVGLAFDDEAGCAALLDRVWPRTGRGQSAHG